MRFSLSLAAALFAVSLPNAVVAEDGAVASASVEIKKNNMIYSSDGKRIGRVHDVVKGRDGSASAQVIYQNKFVYIPVSTLTPGEKGLVSSLTRAEIRSGR